MNSKEFIEKVISRRKELAVSQETIADWLNVTTTTVSQIENGNTEIDINMCLILAEKLDIPVEEIFVRKQQEKPRHDRLLIGMTVVMIVLVVANVLYTRFGDWMMGRYEFNIYTVLKVEDDMVTLKERQPAVYYPEMHVFKVRRTKYNDIWEDVIEGDVIQLWYRFELSADHVNPAFKVEEILISESMRGFMD